MVGSGPRPSLKTALLDESFYHIGSGEKRKASAKANRWHQQHSPPIPCVLAYECNAGCDASKDA